ncbi:MAG: hypothetical protein HQK50_13705 [Oligoflexia bacterium]|nr:hypothetical protein [Oligoflexia bacterium]MBF0366623.1 hypothetical protein [Oligoflexia bacterium]
MHSPFLKGLNATLTLLLLMLLIQSCSLSPSHSPNQITPHDLLKRICLSSSGKGQISFFEEGTGHKKSHRLNFLSLLNLQKSQWSIEISYPFAVRDDVTISWSKNSVTARGTLFERMSGITPAQQAIIPKLIKHIGVFLAYYSSSNHPLSFDSENYSVEWKFADSNNQGPSLRIFNQKKSNYTLLIEPKRYSFELGAYEKLSFTFYLQEKPLFELTEIINECDKKNLWPAN